MWEKWPKEFSPPQLPKEPRKDKPSPKRKQEKPRDEGSLLAFTDEQWRPVRTNPDTWEVEVVIPKDQIADLLEEIKAQDEKWRREIMAKISSLEALWWRFEKNNWDYTITKWDTSYIIRKNNIISPETFKEFLETLFPEA